MSTTEPLADWRDLDLFLVEIWLTPLDKRPQQGFFLSPSQHPWGYPLPYPHIPHEAWGYRVREGSCLCPHGIAEFSPSLSMAVKAWKPGIGVRGKTYVSM